MDRFVPVSVQLPYANPEESAMKPLLLPPALALAVAAGLVLAPARGRAMPRQPAGLRQVPSAVLDVANARNPYGNIDRRVDAGNNTGDSEVERLNDAQLNRNYPGPQYGPGAAPPGYPPPAPGYPPPGYYPGAVPPGYPPPPPGYAPPPPGYAPPRY